MNYKIYTSSHDEIIRPLDLEDLDSLKKRAEIFHKICPVSDFELLKESLDSLQAPSVETVVTMLVDNSGSMRGRPIMFAIGAVGIISMHLDRLGIKNDILGFTTKAWKGGTSREDWLDAGKPENPGRLNDLRHIVYKEASEKLVDVRHNLALMMREGLLKENIDGEAIQWACERLRSQHAERRILLVISDGAPCDGATGEANYKNKPKDDESHPTDYLENHLTQVISDLNEAGDIYLDAIGINHDVSKFYGVGDRIDDLDHLAPTTINKLKNLLLK